MSDQIPILFKRIEELQGGRPWGKFLDAGTGPSSLRWITGLNTSQWTAVTASEAMASEVSETTHQGMRSQDRIVVGNWFDPDLLRGLRFDTVLLDYFVGAIEGYAPYLQDEVFARLRPLVRGRIYLIGVEPYVPFPAADESGRVIREIGCLRDACLLLAGERPYREFPKEWVVRQFIQAGFRVLSCNAFPIIYRSRFIDSQLDMCLEVAARATTGAFRTALKARIGQLRERALSLAKARDGLRHGADYVISAEPAS